MEHSAVQEQGGGAGTRVRGGGRGTRLGPVGGGRAAAEGHGRGRFVAERGGVAGEEAREVAGDRGIALARETEGDQAAAEPRGLGVARDLGEEAVEHDRLDLLARALRAERAAHEGRARAGGGEAGGGGAAGIEELLLRAAAGEHEGREATGLEVLPLRDEAALHVVGERQVHVVPAEEQVPPDRDAAKLEGPLGVERGADEREIRGAPADVAHEHGRGAALAGERREGRVP
ncbi:MAG: hypothetical protein JW751_28265 [Polyangiaceae bacterium]|nr:hypothetical protein [Polyangiaceae bacterium]